MCVKDDEKSENLRKKFDIFYGVTESVTNVVYA